MKELLQDKNMFKERLRNICTSVPIHTVYDIGAHEGTWTAECKEVLPEASYYLFEADTDKKSCLPTENTFFEVLSSTHGSDINYYKTKFQFTTGNSTYRELSQHFDGNNYYIDTRKSCRLDRLACEKGLPQPDMIKLDTQGSELDILTGAGNLLANTKVVYMEVSIHQYNENAPLIGDVLAFMKEHGFYMFDIGELHYIKGALAQIDLFFCKKESPLFRSKWD